jgi:hypothetical protein
MAVIHSRCRSVKDNEALADFVGGTLPKSVMKWEALAALPPLPKAKI